MSYYAHKTEVREIDAELYAQWVANGNPKSDYWTLISDPPSAYAHWDGHQWVEPAPYKPDSCSMRQARLALLQSGLLAQVNPAIAAMPEPQQSQAAIEWEYATTVQRTSPFVLALGSSLGLDDDRLDELFVLAVTL